MINLSDQPTYEYLRKRVEELEYAEFECKQTEEELSRLFLLGKPPALPGDHNSLTDPAK